MSAAICCKSELIKNKENTILQQAAARLPWRLPQYLSREWCHSPDLASHGQWENHTLGGFGGGVSW